MEKFSTIEDAVALAHFAHRNQRDKAGLPYIDHPLRVLATVRSQGTQPYVHMAAVLHDVVEDTPITCVMLKEFGFSEAVVQLVDLLTRKRGESPDEYYSKISKNQDAVMIKLADIGDNTLPWRLSYLDYATQQRLQAKYAHAKNAVKGYVSKGAED
jgi:(p)ppGpp synthase/HD superfamily hydrolase